MAASGLGKGLAPKKFLNSSQQKLRFLLTPGNTIMLEGVIRTVACVAISVAGRFIEVFLRGQAVGTE